MRKSIVIAALLGAASTAGTAQASGLIVNGDFETGDLSGWTVIDQAGGSGSWFPHGNGAAAPLSGTASTGFAGGGQFNALTDQLGPGSHQLTQSFTGVAGQAYILSFDAYSHDSSGRAAVGSGLDYTVNPNQHLEINLSGAATGSIFSGTYTDDWAHYTYDISALITANGLYTLSFGEVDNQSFYNFGLDNVALATRGGAVPEPATWAMMLAGFGLVGGAMRQRRTQGRIAA
ncbi:MAG: PEPxxWA-CTERM sorting domain-containing protein [Sphingomonadales bacterium]|nr:PEPxxWA-CTERM sorting domain-containing protein [Sphingomonadales bacterium]